MECELEKSNDQGYFWEKQMKTHHWGKQIEFQGVTQHIGEGLGHCKLCSTAEPRENKVYR